MKKIIGMLISIISLFITSIFFVYKIQTINKKSEIEITILQNILVDNIFNGIDIPVPKDLKLIDINGNETQLQRIINNRSKLVFFINNLRCDGCINSELNFLDKTLDVLKREDIIIISNYPNINNLRVIKNKYNINYDSYNIVSNDSIPIYLRSQNSPAIFVINQDLKLNSFFIPNNLSPNTTINYYNNINSSLN